MMELVKGIEDAIRDMAQPTGPVASPLAVIMTRDRALGYIAGLRVLLERNNRLLELIAKAYSDDPGTSDLDDEQPLHMSLTLKEVRLARQLLRRCRPSELAIAKEILIDEAMNYSASIIGRVIPSTELTELYRAVERYKEAGGDA